jgi:hypothetical protein
MSLAQASHLIIGGGLYHLRYGLIEKSGDAGAVAQGRLA